MEQQGKKSIPMFIKISVIVNTLLFGITGAIYLSNGNKLIGYTLLAAGFLNVLYMLFSISTKNIVFVILNFIFAAVSLVVCIDYIRSDKPNLAIVWVAIAVVYLIVAFVLLMRRKKRIEAKKEAEDDQ